MTGWFLPVVAPDRGRPPVRVRRRGWQGRCPVRAAVLTTPADQTCLAGRLTPPGYGACEGADTPTANLARQVVRADVSWSTAR
jgi:hypothetical protein